MPPRGSPTSSRSKPVPAEPLAPHDALDLSSPKRVHIVGVAGSGMSAIALLLARMGHAVSGSDTKSAPVLERLAEAGVDVRFGNRPEHVPEHADAVIYSTAIPLSNVELTTAASLGIPVLHRSAALAALSRTRKTVAVAGSHGKTTTSAMLALILRAAEWSPSFVVGADVNDFGANAGFGSGEWMVVEADESDGTFLHVVSRAALVTNVEPDHLDHYGDFPTLVRSFEQFVDTVDGPVVVGADDAVTAQLAAARPRVRTYGYSASAHYRVADEVIASGECRFTLVTPDADPIAVTLPAGVKAATNAAGAIATALELGVDPSTAARALAGFGGVARRFQYRGELGGVAFIDDYAHLPTEVEAAIAAARRGPWRHVVVVFQPHRYSRTASIGRQFGDAFAAADQLVLTDVYSAGEPPIPGVSGRTILGAVLDRHPELPVAYLPQFADLGAVPGRYARPGDLVLTLGAGDLTTMPDVWLGAS
jgi:UDP-N-acetylmuramate--alanine ligase